MTATCSLCDAPVQACGLCHAHYERKRRGSDMNKPMLRTLEERFWAKVDKRDNGCWLWTGATGGDGRYGSFQYKGKVRRAHRAAYEMFVGPVPENCDLDHLCRVTLCVNPEHLEPVSHRENILRGDAPTAKNARKTHCKRGHDLNGPDVYIMRDGGRACRACQRLRNRVTRGSRLAVLEGDAA